MQSKMASVMGLKYEPVALLWSDEMPADAGHFEKGRWGCVMAALGAAADKGKTYAFDRETYGCVGGGVGLGFGNCYKQFVGGEAGFCGFLSSGNAAEPGSAEMMETAKKFMRGTMLEEFVHGEGYRRSPAVVQQFINALPIVDIPTRYVIFKPLRNLAIGERPVSITFFVNPDQLSAMTILANYNGGDGERAIIPHAAGCQNVGIYSYRESRSQRPRAVVGLNDLSARKTLRRLGKDLMTVTLPLALYEEMEASVAGGFLERETWKSLQEA